MFKFFEEEMDKKYGETPQQRLERALNQPSQHDNIFGMSNGQAMAVVLARLTQEFEKGDGPDSFYRAWQDDMANAFIIAYQNKKYNETLYQAADTAAKTFIDNLCKQTKNLDPKKQSE